MNWKFWKTKDVEPEAKKTLTLESSGNGYIYIANDNTQDFSEWTTSWVNTATAIRAENLAKADIVLYQKKGKDKVEVTSNPFLDIVNGVNRDEQTWFELVYLISLSLDIWGKAYVYAVAGTNGKPAEFRFLAPFAMTPVLNTGMTGISHYEFSSASGVTKYTPEEIIFFRLPLIGNPYDGMPTIKSCEKVIEVDNIQNHFQKLWTLNSGNISEIITSEEALSDEAIARLDEAMKAKHDPNNRSPYAIFENGVKFDVVKATAKELDFVNSKIATRDEILSKLRIPKILAGLGQNSNRATANAELWSFIENTIKPFSNFIVSKLNGFIKKTYGKELFVEFEWKNMKSEEEIINEYKEGLIALSEAREELGWSSDKPEE